MTFTDVHRGHQKVPKSDFQSNFSMSKNVRIFLKTILIKNVFYKIHAPNFVFFNKKKILIDLAHIWSRKITLKVRFRHFLMTHEKVSESQNEKKILSFTDFFVQKIYSLLLMSWKLYHQGHAKLFAKPSNLTKLQLLYSTVRCVRQWPQFHHL